MKKFYLGIDIGTDSVGMACTDENYRLLRAKGKDLWAVRLFDEAKSASDRRVFRANRRRLERRKQRIDLLQEIFSPFMDDDLFFLRLNNSGFWEEDKDKRLSSRYSLFADPSYTDKDFYAQYPTIFHLRLELVQPSCASHDLRLYYLALHHIVKYRGHFLFEGEKMDDVADIRALFDTLNTVADETMEDPLLYFTPEQAVTFRKIAMDENKRLKEKQRDCFAALGCDSPVRKELVSLMLGAKVKAESIFGIEYEERYKGEKISFKELSEEEFEGKADVYEDGHFALLQAARAVYNDILFEKVLQGNQYISGAMVSVYEKHKSDLALLKRFIKTQFSADVYRRVFKSDSESANYANYIGYTKPKKIKKSVPKCKKEDFYKFLKKILEEHKAVMSDTETYAYIVNGIEKGDFLPKILNEDNGLFPHQINGIELDRILVNLCKEYPAFACADPDGFTPAEKIRKIFSFRIPYYVGPLNNFHEGKGGNSWIVRREGRITPWNFDDMVDKEASNEKFIRRMTKKCSYLYGKDVLPKCSMIYQKYNVLNQINKLKINEHPIDVQLKQRIFNELFLCQKKITKKRIAAWLAEIGAITKEERKDVSISGIDAEEFDASMNSYLTLKKILGDFVDLRPEVCEDIILLHTLNTDKKIVEESILARYGNEPVIRENIKALKGITSFKDFGRLSKELLCEISGGEDPVTGAQYTILGELYDTNLCFNELLNDGKYAFAREIERANAGHSSIVTYDDVAQLYVSPMVRRGIWQALLMADEYVGAVGRAPDKIFIEVTRGEDKEKKRTVSRRDQLLELYKGLPKDCRDIDDLVNALKGETNARLRQERLYLYYMQLGRCAYTGELIRLDELNTDLYDVDHIFPRSFSKDDSLDNKVLVLRRKNAEKADIYPLPSGFTDQQKFWKLLKDKNLMSDKKYALLTRTRELDEGDFREFLNRQLVVTSQTVKAVAELLRLRYGEQGTKIVYSKAKNVSDFRQRFSIVKCRETNDLHHARDAYLNVVVGNVYDTKFTCPKDYFYLKDDAWREYSLKTLYKYNVKGAWNAEESLNTVLETLQKPSMAVTKYTYRRKGEFYGQQPLSRTKKGVAAPRKGVFPYDQTDKYGGYRSLKISYFAVVQCTDKKGKTVRRLVAVPVLTDCQKGDDREKLQRFLADQGIRNAKVLLPKVKIGTLISLNGTPARIAGTTGGGIRLHNAVQWFTDGKTDKYVKNLAKLVERKRRGELSAEESGSNEFVMETNRNGEVKLCIDRAGNLSLYQSILAKLNGKIYSGISTTRTFAEKLENKKSVFCALTVLQQAEVLMQIVNFMKCNAVLSDLSLLKDGASCGKITMKYDITDVDIAVIHQSPCGLTERVRKI